MVRGLRDAYKGSSQLSIPMLLLVPWQRKAEEVWMEKAAREMELDVEEEGSGKRKRKHAAGEDHDGRSSELSQGAVKAMQRVSVRESEGFCS